MADLDGIKEHLFALRTRLKGHKDAQAQGHLRKLIYQVEMMEHTRTDIPQSALDLAHWLSQLADAEHGTLIKRYPKQQETADANQITAHVDQQRDQLREGRTLHAEVVRSVRHMAGMLGVGGAQAVDVEQKLAWFADTLLQHLQQNRRISKQMHELAIATMDSLQAVQEMLLEMGAESPELRQVAVLLSQPIPEDPVAAQKYLRRISDDLKTAQRNIHRVENRLQGEIDERIGVFADISRQFAQAEASSRSDTLTGLPNRRALKEYLATLDESTISSLAMIDIDALCQINTAIGKAAGDDLLRAIAGRLEERIRAEDMLFRIGGDEFVVVFSAVHGEGALLAARGLCQCVTTPPLVGKKLTLAISVGVAERHGGEGLHAWLKRADAALYVAKGHGGNCAEIVP
ncbi:MAG: GGDEF domain-containing protein [Mariprofundales bacterium]|nr:GGDEF domain-containing protein [Mariprofundales bacterium]